MVASLTYPGFNPAPPATVDTTDRLGHGSRPHTVLDSTGARQAYRACGSSPLQLPRCRRPGVRVVSGPGPSLLLLGPKHIGRVQIASPTDRPHLVASRETPAATPNAPSLDPNISMGLHAAQSDANASEALQHPVLIGDRATLASSRHRYRSGGLLLASNTGLVLKSASAELQACDVRRLLRRFAFLRRQPSVTVIVFGKGCQNNALAHRGTEATRNSEF